MLAGCKVLIAEDVSKALEVVVENERNSNASQQTLAIGI
jgi:hypothetical protein